MSTEYPLYPELSEEAKKEAQALFDNFKMQMKKICDETLGDLYVDVANYIKSDSWGNFRNELMDGFRNYNNRKIQGEYDFKKIREAILREYADQIVCDLNQDLLEEVESLKKEIHRMQEVRRGFN